MKILHGHVRTNVRVEVDDQNATPENSLGYIPVGPGEEVSGHGFYQEHGDSTFTIEPDGTLYLSRDPSKPAFASYGRGAWLWVGDEHGNSVFNTAHPEADPAAEIAQERVPQRA